MNVFPPANQARSVVELHLAVLLFGLAGLFGKLIDSAPQLIAFARTLVAAGALFIVLKLSRSQIAAATQKDTALISVAGVLLAGHWVAFFHSIQISSVAVGVIGFAVFPVFVALIEPIAFRLRYRRIDVFCAIGVASGLAIVAPSFTIDDIATRGLLWAVLSGFLFAILTLINRRVATANEFRFVAFLQYGVASLFLLPFILASDVAISEQSEIFLLLVLGLVFTALPHTLFIKALAGVKATYASVVAGMEPVYGIIFAALLLHEIPTMRTVIGASIVIVAVMAVSRAVREHQL